MRLVIFVVVEICCFATEYHDFSTQNYRYYSTGYFLHQFLLTQEIANNTTV